MSDSDQSVSGKEQRSLLLTPVSYLSSQPHTEEILLTRNSTLEKLNARLNGDHESAQLLWYSRNCSEHLIL